MAISDEKHGRKRIALDLDGETYKIIEGIKKSGGSVRDFCQKAIWRYQYPPFKFHAPRPMEREPIVEFLEDAREILMVGITLSSLQEKGTLDFLSKKVKEKWVPMTFILVDPEIEEEHQVYKVLNQRYGNLFEGGLKGELGRTLKVLTKLNESGREAKIPVRVLGVRYLPMCGMTVIDPHTSWCKMRLGIYLHLYPTESYPFFDIDARTPEGMEACNAFLRHYERLSQVARPILDL